MALIAQVTKLPVKERSRDCFNIHLLLELKEGGATVFEETFVVTYKPHRNIADLEAEVGGRMQRAINRFKRERAVYAASALDTVVGNLTSSLDVGES
jgi:hypothetical protein